MLNVDIRAKLIALGLSFWAFASSCQEPLKRYQTLQLEGHTFDIAVPADSIPVRGNLILLPGWNFPKEDWCLKTAVCKKALARGYRLILPQMGKSTYQTQNYPETRKDWLQYPTRLWLTQKLIPFLQSKYRILTEQENNFILGLSTGARGVLLVTLDLPRLFTAAAALSGDYDQTQIPKDQVITGFYGPFQQFPERWKSHDNVLFLTQSYHTPLYIGHGKLDPIIPYQQSELLYHHLQKIAPNLEVIYHLDEKAKHDYAYWGSEIETILNFFKKHEKQPAK